MRWIFDPRIFNICIIVLSALATVRWTINGSWWSALYWGAATAISVAVTGGIK